MRLVRQSVQETELRCDDQPERRESGVRATVSTLSWLLGADAHAHVGTRILMAVRTNWQCYGQKKACWSWYRCYEGAGCAHDVHTRDRCRDDRESSSGGGAPEEEGFETMSGQCTPEGMRSATRAGEAWRNSR